MIHIVWGPVKPRRSYSLIRERFATVTVTFATMVRTNARTKTQETANRERVVAKQIKKVDQP